MIRIAICDDDIQYMRNNVGQIIGSISKELNTDIKVTLFSDGNRLFNNFKNGIYFDIVILDIDMPSINGKALAEKLRSIDNSFYLAFLTAYKMEVFTSAKYKFNAFIPKDFETEQIESELKRIVNEYLSNKPKFELFKVIRDGIPSMLKTAISNIMYFYLEDKQIYLVTSTEEILLENKIFSSIVNKYIDKGFFESHRNYLVNVGMINEICDNYAKLCNGERVPVSKRSRKGLIQAVSNYIMMEESI